MTLADFVWAAFFYCSMTGGSVKSWIRSKAHNAGEHGVLHSPHLLGLAVDVIYDVALSDAERREWAVRCGLRLLPETDHDHLQPLDWKAG